MEKPIRTIKPGFKAIEKASKAKKSMIYILSIIASCFVTSNINKSKNK